jgi:hypothetical protein
METTLNETTTRIVNDPLLMGSYERSGIFLLGKVLRLAGRQVRENGIQSRLPKHIALRLHRSPGRNEELHASLLIDESDALNIRQLVQLCDADDRPVMDLSCTWLDSDAEPTSIEGASDISNLFPEIKLQPMSEEELKTVRIIQDLEMDEERELPLPTMLRWLLETTHRFRRDSDRLLDMQIDCRADAYGGDQFVIQQAVQRDQEREQIIHLLVNAETGQTILETRSNWSVQTKVASRSKQYRKSEASAV